MRPFDPAAMIDDYSTSMPNGGGILLATAIMLFGWLAMYLLV